ncbi:tetraspanin-1 [Pectinophora gossypiella]|uniref:tetraspanin-1 n=1 Tax=Pectinophora gossypiella TaxID=13191 RepID=UPI00214EC088|nr:tetraspanin-1 [Pectinophora gossypiella]
MKCKNAASAKVLFGFFNTIFFACGFLEVVCGFLLLCDTQRVLLSRLLAAPDAGLAHPPFYYLALALLAAGLAMCATSALGCWATYMPGYFILTIYFLAVLALLLWECAGGVVAAVWPRCVGLHSAAGGAAAALQAYYAVPDYEQFTASVDLAQTQLECCGITDARNYDMSLWQLRRLGPRGMAVPPSCCVQRAGLVSHLNPAPLNNSRCQELTPDPHYRYIPGCIGKLEDWYQQQYIVFMMALFVVALFKLGILLSTVFACIRLRKRRQDVHSFIMKSLDNKHENFYDSKMGTLHEEPIMAKYIQPNNFYSPRVRNPRIFPTKPNEMV